MAREGREFEIMIRFLEEALGPKGISVKSPDYIKGKLSGSTREVDISLKGKIGSTDVLVIIECRDRSDTEDVTWIEQLATKAEDVGAAKVIAVSATGFSSGAEKTASLKNIDLRTYAQIDANEILLWFGFKEIDFISRHVEFRHIGMFFEAEIDVPALPPEVQSKLAPVFDIYAPLFSRKSDGSQFNFMSIWNSLPLDQIYENVTHDGTKTRKHLSLPPGDPANCWQFPTNKGLLDIKFFEVEADIWTKVIKIPLTAIRRYRGGEEIIVETAVFDFQINDQRFAIDLHKFSESGHQAVVLRKKPETAKE